eukprot:TRINITY_DN13641_c1_g1_i1.p2 TRINITY_DN13641_c1_g1~~TRINITY_DN13641_c1_g1_i1.p2  ORF type:complete len:405 (+),score=146.15 TRINITY_DN13641_c1_g1_i1:67-1281(+)
MRSAALLAAALGAAAGPADRSLCFVIDDTGSMGPDIEAVRNVADRLLYLSDAPHFVLVGFNDPVPVNLNVSTTNRSAFHDAYHKIQPSGGGDCPELFYEGALKGVELAHPYSTCFLFTDAPAKDPSYAKDLIEAAKAKNIALVLYISPGCGSPCWGDGRQGWEVVLGETGGGLWCLGQKNQMEWYLDSPERDQEGLSIKAQGPPLVAAPAIWPKPAPPVYNTPKTIACGAVCPNDADDYCPCGVCLPSADNASKYLCMSRCGANCTKDSDCSAECGLCSAGKCTPPPTPPPTPAPTPAPPACDSPCTSNSTCAHAGDCTYCKRAADCKGVAGMDVGGGVVGSPISGLNATECCALCARTDGCLGAVLLDKALGGQCYLKDQSGMYANPNRTALVPSGKASCSKP